MAHVETEARILGGLPVIVVGRTFPAEPDIGCSASAEVEDICWLTGKSIPTRMWQRITDSEYRDLCDALLECLENEA